VGGGGGGQPAAPAPSPWGELDFRAKHRLAKDVGAALGGVLQQLAAGEPEAAATAAAAAPPPRRVLLGHSLGGRVVLHALASLAPPVGQRQQQPPAVAAAAVFGAAPRPRSAAATARPQRGALRAAALHSIKQRARRGVRARNCAPRWQRAAPHLTATAPSVLPRSPAA
jgi:alpha-beta hydrolase superfamily lysophospholipase